MPRIRDGVSEAEVTPDTTNVAAVGVAAATNADGDAPKKERAPRRAAPDGVNVGLLDAPEPVSELPKSVAPAGGRRGRAVSPATLAIINQLEANPGQWFKIGTFMSSQNPGKDSPLGSKGYEFSNVRNDNGTFDRFARKPGDAPAE